MRFRGQSGGGGGAFCMLRSSVFPSFISRPFVSQYHLHAADFPRPAPSPPLFPLGPLPPARKGPFANAAPVGPQKWDETPVQVVEVALDAARRV